MILIIDNYDSFVYNIYQYTMELYDKVEVRRNDEIAIKDIIEIKPKAIILSPGPGIPSKAGICEEVIRKFAGKIPMLGVCLGHQAIGEVFGGKIIHAKSPIHGKKSDIFIKTTDLIFKGLPECISVGRYHSLIVDKSTFPDTLEIIGMSKEKEIMALKHKEYPIYGVQFHPESILTEYGKFIFENFIKQVAVLSTKPIKGVSRPKQVNILKPYLQKVINKMDLTIEEAQEIMENIMSGMVTHAQIGAFLAAMRMKGETVEEITGFVKVMRQKARTITLIEDAIDIVGTGGDLSGTFNISTTVSFVVAGAGLNVAKHGNRSVSSQSGSADVLEALGVKIQLGSCEVIRCIEKTKIGFMFAPCFHQAMKFVALPRKEIGVRSVFNILGPLANPAGVSYILLGVYEEKLLEIMGRVLMNLGIKKGIVVYGTDGLDEVSLSSITKICEVQGNRIIKYEISPEMFGMGRCTMEEVKGGVARQNAQITMEILEGKVGAKRDIVILNAAVALYCGEKVSSIEEGIIVARDSIDSGNALIKLNELRKFSNGEETL